LGGAEKLLLQIIGNLDFQKFEVVLITQKNKGILFEQIKQYPIKIYSTRNPFTLWGILRKEKPQVFHSHLWRSDLLGIPIAKLAGVPVVCSTKHNLQYFRGVTKAFILFDVLCMCLCDVVFAVSNAVKEHYLGCFAYRNLSFRVVHNGIDLKPFLGLPHSKVFADGKTVQMLTVANLIAQKGHLEFLDVLSRMMYLPWEWHLVGDGPLRKTLEKRVGVLKLESRVHFYGRQTDVLSYYKKADLFVLPSLWEGFGLVLLEAMASGVPIFASQVDGVKEILENEKTAILFNPLNPEETEKKLRQLLKNPLLQEKLAETAQTEVLRFSIQKMMETYQASYSG
jgi:glycosyltransferase involved in cell wall biosynthesis